MHIIMHYVITIYVIFMSTFLKTPGPHTLPRPVSRIIHTPPLLTQPLDPEAYLVGGVSQCPPPPPSELFLQKKNSSR